MIKIDSGLRIWAALLVALAAVGLTLVAAQSARAGAFPGANGKIAFVSNRDTFNDQIYTMNPNGAGLMKLTKLTTIYSGSYNPSFSSDGTRIVFDRQNEIWIMNADGTGQRQLTNNSVYDHDPTFSPSGNRIAFLTRRGDDGPGGVDNIWVMNADGSGQTRLTSGTNVTEPTWAPKGNMIAFARAGALWVRDLTSNTETQYTFSNTGNPDTSVGNVRYPTWSPDGSLIEFTGTGGQLHCSCSGYFSISSAGGTPTTIGFSDPSDAYLAFSPDGARIALQSNRSGNQEIYTMNPDGSGQADITNNTAKDIQPDWGPKVTQQGTSLSLSANPATISSGQSSTLSGKLVTANGKVYAGQKVTIKQKPAGASSFSNLKTVSTDFNGRFKTAVKPKKNTYYRAVFGGNSVLGLGSSSSTNTLVKVGG